MEEEIQKPVTDTDSGSASKRPPSLVPTVSSARMKTNAPGFVVGGEEELVAQAQHPASFHSKDREIGASWSDLVAEVTQKILNQDSKIEKLEDKVHNLSQELASMKQMIEVHDPRVPKGKQSEEVNFDAIGYECQDAIGQGIYSVYKVNNKKGEFFALKWVTLEGGEITPKVGRELSIMRDLQHDNILRLYKAFVHRNSVCLITELMERDMLDHIQLCEISLEEVKVWLKQIVSAVAYLHDRGIIHRDLKPENLLLTSDRNVKLADFGLARGFFKGDRLTPQVTTMQYRAPELLFGSDNYTAAVDMWSIGCIFWDMLMSNSLFESGTEEEIIQQIFKKFGCPTESTWPGVTSLPNFPRDIQCDSTEVPLEIDTKLSPDCYDLLTKLLCLNPNLRIDAQKALKHSFLSAP